MEKTVPLEAADTCLVVNIYETISRKIYAKWGGKFNINYEKHL